VKVMRPSSIFKRRIETLIKIWSDILETKTHISREMLEEKVKEEYRRASLEPIRGKNLPEDIYSKELSSLYVVGVHGLGLKEELKHILEGPLKWECKVEESVRKVLNEGSVEAVWKEFGKELSENDIAKILRIPFTLTLFKYMSEDEFAKLIKLFKSAYPNRDRVLRNYTRFYIAYKIAELIGEGKLKSKTIKEIVKKSTAIKFGFEKSTPSDNYISFIAKNILKVRRRNIDRVLK